MAAYLKMMKTLKETQNEKGMWRQLVDDPELWEETSGSAMFTYAMIVGVKKRLAGCERVWRSCPQRMDCFM